MIQQLHACARAVADTKVYVRGDWLDQDIKMELMNQKLGRILCKHVLTMLAIYCKPPSRALESVWTTREVDGVFHDLHKAGMPYEQWVQGWLSGEGKQCEAKLARYLGPQTWKEELDRDTA